MSLTSNLCLQHSTYAYNILPTDTTSYLHVQLFYAQLHLIGPSTLSYLYLLMTVNLHLVSTAFVALIQWKMSTYWGLSVFANFVYIFVNISSLHSVHLCLCTPEICLFCHKYTTPFLQQIPCTHFLISTFCGKFFFLFQYILLNIISVQYTVNKLRSINLLFSSMFRIESKIVHVGA